MPLGGGTGRLEPTTRLLRNAIRVRQAHHPVWALSNNCVVCIRTDSSPCIEVSDDGVGFPEGFDFRRMGVLVFVCGGRSVSRSMPSCDSRSTNSALPAK